MAMRWQASLYSINQVYTNHQPLGTVHFKVCEPALVTHLRLPVGT